MYEEEQDDQRPPGGEQKKTTGNEVAGNVGLKYKEQQQTKRNGDAPLRPSHEGYR